MHNDVGLHLTHSPVLVVLAISRLLCYCVSVIFNHTLSLALKVPARAHDRNTLVHNRLSHPQVILNPLLDARGL